MSMRLVSSLLILITLVLCLLFLRPVYSQENDCDDPCGGTSADGDACRRGNHIRVDAVLHNAGDDQYAAFCVKVDRFSQTVLNGSWSLLSSANDTSATLQMQAAGMNNTRVMSRDDEDDIEVQDPRLFWSQNLEKFVGFYVLIIQMDDGVVERLYFDDTCNSDQQCKIDSSQSCVNGTDCAVERNVFQEAAQATQSTSDQFPTPDVRSFVAFVGTDRNGNSLNSAGSIPTRYRSFSVGNPFSDMYGQYNRAKDLVNRLTEFPLSSSLQQLYKRCQKAFFSIMEQLS
eukprot:gb/GECH01006468.1/.p1 GENE.gb/GECH01006468.1/~~gb/GECH01006468.1/.p1  ORF type:complete len:286 (+),score=39.64 gb/GECH01006468.1/:1-858(+)